MQSLATFKPHAAFMENPVREKNKPLQIPYLSMGDLPAGRYHGLLPDKKTYATKPPHGNHCERPHTYFLIIKYINHGNDSKINRRCKNQHPEK